MPPWANVGSRCPLVSYRARTKSSSLAFAGEAESAAHLATGFVRGNPLWNQLVERGIDADALEARVARALAERFGDHPCRSPQSAHLLVARA